MKKILGVLGLALAAATLAGCGEKEGTASTSAGPTREPIPAKTGWTEDEELLMSEILGHDLPHYKDLALSEPGEEDPVLVGLGNYGEASDLAAYGQLLEGKGFVEYECQAEDIAEVADFAESVDPVYYAYFDNQSGYIPYKGAIVAAGIDAESGRFMTVSTRFYNILGSYFTSDNQGWSAAAWDDDEGQGIDAEIKWWVSALGSDEDATEADMAALEAKVILPEDLGQLSFFGIDDYQFINPFTYGNNYSKEFAAAYDIYFAGFTAAEATAYITRVTAAGYEARQTTSGDTLYVLEQDEGKYIIGFQQDDEFWKVDPGEDATGAYLSFGFFPNMEEEAAA